jgi:phosphate starvation-inducible membrane PsiE
VVGRCSFFCLFKTTILPARYLVYIAITALSRFLIKLVLAEYRTGIVVLIVAGAILGLSFAVLVLRFAGETSNGLDAPLQSVKGDE